MLAGARKVAAATIIVLTAITINCPSLAAALVPRSPDSKPSFLQRSELFLPNPVPRHLATNSDRRVFVHHTVALLFSLINFGTSSSCVASPDEPLTRSGRMSATYWNRETSAVQSFDADAPVTRAANILCLSDPDDASNAALYDGSSLPNGSRVLAIGKSFEDFDLDALKEERVNVIFVSHWNTRETLSRLLIALPSIEWVHARSAGIDSLTSKTLTDSPVILTNAKGHFSSTLAEYAMMACSYFAKDLPRLLRQKNVNKWEKYDVEEIRGKTMGIIGYGDIGRATARLAKAYGMTVVALRRNPEQNAGDPICDKTYGNDQDSINRLMGESDYILVAAPLTEETRGLVGRDALGHAKANAVLINVGRGPIVDEAALIATLKNGKLKGAALDVFTTEPLPVDSELWSLDNVLLSPHNMDQTATFMQEATEFFINENIPRFVRGMELLNPVNKGAGY